MSTRLPGITFETVRPTAPPILPRMDIAGFVGLASSGPVNTPVFVQDIQRYRDIFGADLPLVWNPARQQTRYAYLGTAVEAFFRNGGQRCWVVRVAGLDPQQQVIPPPHQFMLPQLITPDATNPAQVSARSMGSWADNLRVGLVLRRHPLSASSVSQDAGDAARYQLTLDVSSGALLAGDLLGLTFADTDYQNDLLLLAVDTLDPDSTPETQIVSGVGYWFQYRDLAAPAPAVAQIRRIDVVNETLDLDGATAEIAPNNPADPDDPELIVTISPASGMIPPKVGDLLHLTLDDDDDTVILFPITAAFVETNSEAPHEDRLELHSTGWLIPLTHPDELAVTECFAEGWTFAMQVWRGQQIVASLDKLGFGEQHPRWWGQLLDDETLFRRHEGRAQPEPLSDLQQSAAIEPRYPLAAPPDAPPLVLPVGMALTGTPDNARLPYTDRALETRLARDGVAEFDPAMFLDPDLKSLTVSSLAAAADHKYYIQGEDLQGFYSLLPLEDVTLIALPDAVHRAWKAVPGEPVDLLAAPALDPISEPAADADSYEVTWAAVPEATAYTLQVATNPAFDDPTPYTRVVVDPDSPDEWSRYRLSMPECPQRRYYRVRAERDIEVSAWSNTEMAFVPPLDFEIADEIVLEPPVLALGTDPVLPTITWGAVDDVTGYDVAQAETPGFLDETLYPVAISWTVFTPTLVEDGIYYFRVRGRRDELVGPWSNTVVIQHFARSVMQLIAEHELQIGADSGTATDNLLDVQAALLRYCAARGTVFAVLGMPDTFGADDARQHIANLRALFGSDERHILSFGALYYPWLVLRPEVPGGTHYAPAQGTVTGMLAARSLARGAWIAPANTPLVHVLGHEPAVARDEWAELYTAGINVVRRDPRGFITLSEHTLSTAADYTLIHVRRLLALLRRLAVREGMKLVFEPNDAAFRRLVRHRFEQVLDGLYRRGAFAGATPEQAYRVVTDTSVNPPEQTALGRFVVELKIAPAQPMVFITVRLLQQGDQGLVIEEG